MRLAYRKQTAGRIFSKIMRELRDFQNNPNKDNHNGKDFKGGITYVSSSKGNCTGEHSCY